MIQVMRVPGIFILDAEFHSTDGARRLGRVEPRRQRPGLPSVAVELFGRLTQVYAHGLSVDEP